MARTSIANTTRDSFFKVLASLVELYVVVGFCLGSLLVAPYLVPSLANAMEYAVRIHAYLIEITIERYREKIAASN